ncbi:thermonuclease family protein [Azospirillum picis]|uniref:Endonuclease YncB(Thermonuclease family) n=1 Tax=Azospirillum picis TaxID=488438 RepID=A0ABU0MLJ3_9PROT|nr:thermonuclease family protein [Azospirillum picis]MBP2300465.1 endonuclease YncB(thermonuclease family) [Azospirillum picis]MDQ0534261.1 endonuclease YncB(thermonuclease family) [Azospirillum picis]
MPALVLLAGLLLAGAVRADALRVTAVLDGDTLELEDGRQVRLAGIEAAKPPRGADPRDGRVWPLAEAARAMLAQLALGRPVVVHGPAPTDRHGRLLAHLVRDDGLWLQSALVARGLARVHTRPDASAYAAELLAEETAARDAGRGLWRSRVYALRDAGDPAGLARDRDSFQVVEGVVLRVSKGRGESYLDFGEDWRSDVTVHIGRAAMRDLVRAGIDPLSYEGRRVRVRGWILLRNGPMIEITHPAQIERLEREPPPAAGPSPWPGPAAGPAADADGEDADPGDELRDGDATEDPDG